MDEWWMNGQSNSILGPNEICQILLCSKIFSDVLAKVKLKYEMYREQPILFPAHQPTQDLGMEGQVT